MQDSCKTKQKFDDKNYNSTSKSERDAADARSAV